MRFRRTRSNCAECPLRDRKKVNGIYEIDKPKIAVLGEAPGAEEDQQGMPFVGGAGKLLAGACGQAGIMFKGTYRFNVIPCRPTNNDITTSEAQEAIECCKEGFQEELDAVLKLGVKVVAAVGNTAAKAMGIPGNITKIRGSVYPVGKGAAVVPTFHPSYILRGAWKEEPTWVNDLIKVKEISLKSWKPPKERFELFPKVGDVEKFADECVKKKSLVGVDIEGFKKILMIGLSTSEEDVMVVPFYRQGGLRYWSQAEESRVRKAVNKILKSCPTMYQNAQFDVYHLEGDGYTVGNIAEDTMILHHAIHPELPHNLGYIVSVYGKTPYWKDVRLQSDEMACNLDDTEFRTYNARDSAVLHQVIGPMLEHLKEVGTEFTYREIGMKLLRPLMDMKRRGMLVDQKVLASCQRKFKKKSEKLEKEIYEMLNLPEGFNLDSGDHMRMLMYGDRPKSYPKAIEEFRAYEADTKKRRDTKKYKELVDKIKLVESVVPLRMPTDRVRTTESGLSACDDAAMLSIQQAAINRLESMEYLKRPTELHAVEKRDLNITLKFIEMYREYSKNHKLASTYSKYPLGEDGRVHANYKIHGTATGRLSSSDVNMQNQPKEVLDVFVAPKGMALVKADYSNIEVRVMAYIANEPVLIEALKQGVNIHDLNTRIMFGIDKDHPEWEIIRRAAKVFVFGRLYGGSVGGIYKEVVTQVPQVRLTLAKFVEADRRFFEKLAGYREWCKSQVAKAHATRVIETAFGRKRFLLGTEDEIERQALNTPIQGTAGEVCEMSIIQCHEKFKAKPEWNAHLIGTVHDSIIVECQESAVNEVGKAMKKIMEKPYKIGKQTVSFPVDFAYGPSWGNMDDLEV